MHGTRGTTGSEGCLLLYSVVGNSSSHSFALLPKFEAGKPGGESGSAVLSSAALPVLSGKRDNPVASAGLKGAILLPAQD